MNAPRSLNASKYEATNPVVQWLLGRFYDRLAEVVAPLAPSSVLDVGCGEGFALERLGALLPAEVRACDLSADAVEECRARVPTADVRVASVLELPYDDGQADLVICLEVLEHLDDPARGLAELLRVTRRDLVVSVPWEPWFQLGNLARGKYLQTLGNHPEHVQRWSPEAFRAFLRSRAGSAGIRLHGSFPWTIAHIRLAE